MHGATIKRGTCTEYNKKIRRRTKFSNTVTEGNHNTKLSSTYTVLLCF
jgi:hypothetical protein